LDESTELDEIPKLHDHWLLLRRGKTNFHVVYVGR
jgi:hypothetical protein